jgi:hypothetical protein
MGHPVQRAAKAHCNHKKDERTFTREEGAQVVHIEEEQTERKAQNRSGDNSN